MRGHWMGGHWLHRVPLVPHQLRRQHPGLHWNGPHPRILHRKHHRIAPTLHPMHHLIVPHHLLLLVDRETLMHRRGRGAVLHRGRGAGMRLVRIEGGGRMRLRKESLGRGTCLGITVGRSRLGFRRSIGGQRMAAAAAVRISFGRCFGKCDDVVLVIGGRRGRRRFACDGVFGFGVGRGGNGGSGGRFGGFGGIVLLDRVGVLHGTRRPPVDISLRSRQFSINESSSSFDYPNGIACCRQGRLGLLSGIIPALGRRNVCHRRVVSVKESFL